MENYTDKKIKLSFVISAKDKTSGQEFTWEFFTENKEQALKECIDFGKAQFQMLPENIEFIGGFKKQWHTIFDIEEDPEFNLEFLPEEIKEIFHRYSMEDATYDSLKNLSIQLQPYGYEIDYYLDAEITSIRKFLRQEEISFNSEKEFRVTWEIDITAFSHREAAEKAFNCIQKPGTTATVFQVLDQFGIKQEIDLLNEF